jgi:hypothetical protein
MKYSQIDGFAASAADIPVFTKWGPEARSVLQKASGKVARGVYVHFAHGDEGEADWYSERKLVALKELKSKYDPWGVFSFYNAVRRTGY